MKRTILLFLITVLLSSCASNRVRLTQDGVCGCDLDGSYLYGRFNDSRTEEPLIPGLLQYLYLANDDGSAHTGHLGGLAAGDDSLWILGEADRRDQLIMPPMSEAIALEV